MSVSKFTLLTFLFSGIGAISLPDKLPLIGLGLGSYVLAKNITNFIFMINTYGLKVIADVISLICWKYSLDTFTGLSNDFTGLTGYFYSFIGWYSGINLGAILTSMVLEGVLSTGARYWLNSLMLRFKSFMTHIPEDVRRAWLEFIIAVSERKRLINIRVGNTVIYSNTVNTPIDADRLEELCPLRCPGLNNVKVPTYPQDHCYICMDEYNDKQLCRILPCGHSFHAPCVDDWLIRSSASCPICRKDLV